MDRPVQRLVIIVLALLLVLPLGYMGITGLMGGPSGQDPSSSQGQQDPADDRPDVDPADQPQRPEIAKPEPPAAMTEQTAAGAEATLTYLLDSYTYMMTTGDTSVWEQSTDPNCSVCMTFLANARVLNEQGGYLVDGEFTVESTSFQAAGGDAPADGDAAADSDAPADGGSAAPGDGGSAAPGDAPASGLATVTFTQAESILVDDPTKESIPLEAVTGQIQAQMVWNGERWLVGDMSYLPTGAGTGASDGGGTGAGTQDGGGTEPADGGTGG
ncbi:DUF6318 family protein [Brachybacterium sp. p3-SID1565]|uniref:DUF6318 family protein n=1 Tax=Brachybacterium sp. p3-SID1565 TaxID=2916046 RepID=UPI0021A7DF7F|nr:DUF6318 family protein [Brachybacterium sp. p3-SID1565]MCT1385432.1 DUF6318 family protein [Brachybacterium sp. p3-SID1565]